MVPIRARPSCARPAAITARNFCAARGQGAASSRQRARMSRSALMSATRPFHLLSTCPKVTGSTASPNGSTAAGAWLPGFYRRGRTGIRLILRKGGTRIAKDERRPNNQDGDGASRDPTEHADVPDDGALGFRERSPGSFVFRDAMSSAAAAAALRRARGRGNFRKQRAEILMRSRKTLMSEQARRPCAVQAASFAIRSGAMRQIVINP